MTLPHECDFILIDIECDDECGQADCVTCVVLGRVLAQQILVSPGLTTITHTTRAGNEPSRSLKFHNC